jgi:hypothetical protein
MVWLSKDILDYEVMKQLCKHSLMTSSTYVSVLALCVQFAVLTLSFRSQRPRYCNVRSCYLLANPAFLPPLPNRMLGGTNWSADIAPERSSMTTSGFTSGVFPPGTS